MSGKPGDVAVLPWRGAGVPRASAGDDRAGFVAFVDEAGLDQASLYGLLAANAVRGLLDARPVCVFGKPKYRHREVMTHLMEVDVRLVEAWMRVDWRASPPASPFVPPLEAEISLAMGRGLLLCLFDRETVGRGWVDPLRHLVRNAPGYRAELHPRSLLRP